MGIMRFIWICLLLVACVPSPPQLTAIAETSRAQTLTAAPALTPTFTPTATITPTPTITSTPTLPPEPVLVGAGDIADCSSEGDDITARLLDRIEGTVYTTGDNAYGSGTTTQFSECYDPTWGRHKARTRPSAGNHDYITPGAAGYFGYFGPLAGNPGEGFYSYDLGDWHIIVLNSNVSVRAGSPQETWLRADLAAHPVACTLAYWHHPRFSSGINHGSDTSMHPLWQALYDYGADVVLNGHEHNYERFALQNPAGEADPVRGLREFVVGTGGKVLYAFSPRPAPNTEVRDSRTFGVLKLTLHPTSYSWEFIPEPGKTFTDSGTAPCVTPDLPAALASVVPIEQLTFTPTDDATVNAESPDSNFGSDPLLKTDQDPQEDFLMKFTVSGTEGRHVERAILELYNLNSSDRGVEIYEMSENAWSEMSVTWNSAPSASTNPISILAPISAKGWHEVDLSTFITRDGTYSIRIVPASDDGADFSSKEGPVEWIPRLVLEIAVTATPTP